MRRMMLVAAALSAFSAGSTLSAGMSSALATTRGHAGRGADLAMTGQVEAGVRSAQLGQHVPFSFTMTNKSSSTSSASVAFIFTVTNGTADMSDYVCPLTTNRFNIFPDTPACEPGALAAGRHTRAAIIVTPISAGMVTVMSCASQLTLGIDPVPSNNCKTLSIKIG